MVRKMFWLAAYAATGVGLMATAIIRSQDTLNAIILLVIAIFYGISLFGHFKELSK
ncbi:hypothetical protein [Clostridium formicaceticum]|uniref:Uncharacterized protein n=1 Tax=Clostridium formicaceticum TaxID=1497 RepID=A0AAC9RPC3_9CLOT|nr:hypothetical protein [Clostridium formicaceticum]ARE89252.1 hypothetical protein CLFO_36590 [Clostridium formicaceticum]